MNWPNFHLSEFLCKCCGGGADIIDPVLIDRLQAVRNDFGFPMVVDCGFRCPEHNYAVGGAPDSAHILGEAADIADPEGTLAAWMTDERLEQYGLWAESKLDAPLWEHYQIRPTTKRRFRA